MNHSDRYVEWVGVVGKMRQIPLRRRVEATELSDLPLFLLMLDRLRGGLQRHRLRQQTHKGFPLAATSCKAWMISTGVWLDSFRIFS